MKKGARVDNKIKISNRVRGTLILLSIIIIAVGSGNLIKSFTSKKDIVTEGRTLYRYDNKFSCDAKINLKENAYIHEEEMVDGQTYLSDLISNINMNTKYVYKASVPSKIEYTYKVEIIMKATYTDSKSSYDVLNKTDKIKEKTTVSDVTNELVLEDENSVDYANYHQTMREFKQTMGISTDAQLIIRYTINTKTIINSKEVKNDYITEYKISIGDKVAIIEPMKNEDTSREIKEEKHTTENSNININIIIANCLLLFTGLFMLKFTINRTEELKTIKNEFKLELNRILKSYEDKIVEIKDLNNFDINTATKVKDIVQLRKLAEEAFVPIYCYIKEDEAYFIVIKYENRYVFVLK